MFWINELRVVLGKKPDKYSFLIEAGDKICYRNVQEDAIYIKSNPKFYLKWSLRFFLVGFAILIIGLSKIEHFNVVTICMVGIPSMLFFGVGIGYGYRLKQRNISILDLDLNVFNIHNRIIWPFEEITCFELSSRYDGSSDTFSNRRIYELYVVSKRKIKHQLIQAETADEIWKLGELFSSLLEKKLIRINKR